MTTPAQQAYQILTGLGLSPGAATGVVGNLMAESGLRTDAVGDGGAAHGIAQWHPDRYAPMQRWALAHGLNPNSLEAQVRYVAVEAQTGVGGNVWGDLQKTTSPYEAARLFMAKFERPADQSQAAANRRAQAGITALKGDPSTWEKIKSGVAAGPGLALDLLPGGDAVGGAVQGAKDVGSAVAWLTDSHNLLRVVYVVGGSAMILVGLALAARPITAPIASTIAGGPIKAATKLAAAA